MKIVVNRFIPFGRFTCINLFGVVFTKKPIETISPEVINHEYIHTKQYVELTFVLFVLFLIITFVFGFSFTLLISIFLVYYVWYATEWAIRLVLALRTLSGFNYVIYKSESYRAYRRMFFEREAFKFQDDLDYLNRRKAFAWLRL